MMKKKLLQVWIYLRGTVGIPLLIVIALLIGYFAFAAISDWQTRRGIELQGKRIDQYAAQSDRAISQANQYIEISDRTHLATRKLLEVVKRLTDDVKKITDQDRQITVQVKNDEQNYEKTRSQSQKNSGNPRARSNRPLRDRETDALAADKRLYPD